MGVPRPVQPGDPVSAGWANDLRDALAELAPLRAGAGLTLSRAGGIVALALAGQMREYLLPARITAVHGQDGNVNDSVTYDAAVIGESAATVTNVRPVYGREVDGVEIRTARAGDLCLIVRLPNDTGGQDSDLWILTERLLTYSCGPQAGASLRGAGPAGGGGGGGTTGEGGTHGTGGPVGGPGSVGDPGGGGGTGGGTS